MYVRIRAQTYVCIFIFVLWWLVDIYMCICMYCTHVCMCWFLCCGSYRCWWRLCFCYHVSWRIGYLLLILPVVFCFFLIVFFFCLLSMGTRCWVRPGVVIGTELRFILCLFDSLILVFRWQSKHFFECLHLTISRFSCLLWNLNMVIPNFCSKYILEFLLMILCVAAFFRISHLILMRMLFSFESHIYFDRVVLFT